MPFNQCLNLASIGICRASVKDKPFTAHYEMVLENKLFHNKMMITDRATCKIMRDDQGRTRIESSKGDQHFVAINDAVANCWYGINPQTKKAISRDGLFDIGFGQSKELYDLAKLVLYAGNELPEQFKDAELLGPKKLESLTCHGLRYISTGMDEQDNHMLLHFEFWISEELEEIVASAFIETKVGPHISDLIDATTFKELHIISDIKPGKVDPDLFIVPADYQITAGGRLIFD